MTIFLPRPELKLEDWLAKQGRGKDWQAAVSAMKDREGNVKLPRVKFDFSAGLEKTLQTLGIQRAFTDDAQFDGILQNSDPLKIDFVIHKTHIDIDEQGTKAAAATSIVMRAATAANPNAKKEEPFYMRIDRPFFLTIGDAKNRKILFMGIVRQPDRAK
jgi:serpin B